jgi:XTP/dITP diphosphohydrolase
MDRLRSPEGCPWDARQTHATLVEYLIEEAYETVEAIETQDDAGLREELGDLLLQVVFHARIAQERADGPWSIDDVADGIIAKLVRRHPHVFADGDAVTAADVEANWHAIKAQEKGRESVTDGIPAALPALVHMGKVLSRSATLDLPGLPRADEAAVIVDGAATDEEFGDLLLALVAEARARGIDAEAAARAASRRLVERIRRQEGL